MSALVSWLVDRRMRQRHARHRARLDSLDLPARSPWCATVSVTDAAQGVVTVASPRSRVLILGGGPSRVAAPLDDPAYEVWSCNDLAPLCVDSEGRFRADRWFEIHPRDRVVEWRRRPDFWAWLATLPIPVYQFGRHDNPQSVEFPLQRVLDIGRDYFACTFAYQIGLAMADGFTTIALYGVDLITAREATVERATVEWWTGYAAGRGITIEWPTYPDDYIAAGHHPARYGTSTEVCEYERAVVYDWVRDRFRGTIDGFLIANRPPQTIREYLHWRRAAR